MDLFTEPATEATEKALLKLARALGAVDDHLLDAGRARPRDWCGGA